MRILRAFSVGFIFVLFLFLANKQTFAIEDPLSRDNNMMGIHILFPSEVSEAHDLVDTSGGDWGYVTIPIQIGDWDLDKWQNFMNDCRTYHMIPIIRIATEPNWENTATWRKPNDGDIVDAANFLNSLDWPTKNRYVILFNEVNRFDEWGGQPPDPAGYADLVKVAHDTFKARSDDFYLILSGMDNAAPNDGKHYISDMQYLAEMRQYNPTIFDDIDGFASHSYPNPDFSAPPSTTRMSIATYRYEYQLINANTFTKKPVFLTETGWNRASLGETTIANYFTQALSTIWSQDTDKIVAITPFLLDSESGDFTKFSFLDNGRQTQYYKVFSSYPKEKGNPDLAPAPATVAEAPSILGTTIKNFTKKIVPQTPQKTLQSQANMIVADATRMYLKGIFGYGVLW